MTSCDLRFGVKGAKTSVVTKGCHRSGCRFANPIIGGASNCFVGCKNSFLLSVTFAQMTRVIMKLELASLFRIKNNGLISSKNKRPSLLAMTLKSLSLNSKFH